MQKHTKPLSLESKIDDLIMIHLPQQLLDHDWNY